MGASAIFLRPTPFRVRDGHPDMWLDSKCYITTSSNKVSSWKSVSRLYDFTNVVSAMRPAYSATAKTMTFDGGDMLSCTGKLLSASAGRVIVAVRHVAKVDSQVVFGLMDNDAENTYLTLGINADGKCRYAFNAEGTADDIIGNTVLTEAWHIIEFASSGTVISMVVDGTTQTLAVVGGGNNGKWFDDVTDPNFLSIGCRSSSVENTLYFVGTLGEIVAFESAIPTAKASRVRRALGREYSVTIA
jgi:hypothetical protein